jgi:hypothetical protein
VLAAAVASAAAAPAPISQLAILVEDFWVPNCTLEGAAADIRPQVAGARAHVSLLRFANGLPSPDGAEQGAAAGSPGHCSSQSVHSFLLPAPHSRAQRYGFIGCGGVCMRCGRRAAAAACSCCGKCRRVSYCSSACRLQHASTHREVCAFLQRCSSEADLEDAKWGLHCNMDALVARSRAADIKAPTGWAGLRALAAEASLPLDGAACVGLSAPTTLQNALLLLSSQRPPLLDLKADGRTLVVHVPGAAAIEAAAPPSAWTMLPATPSLHVHLVGPNLQQQHADCSANGLTSAVTCSAMKYEEFRAGGQGAPDVIVGLNMGLSCLDYDWAASLQAMLLGLAPGQRLPFAFATASYEELLEEVLVLQQRCGFTVVESRENVWAWPLLLQSGTTACDCYRKSSWLCVGTIEDDGGRKKRRT